MTIEVKITIPEETKPDGTPVTAARVRTVSGKTIVQEEIMEHGGTIQRYVNSGQRIVIEEVSINADAGDTSKAG